MRPVTRLTRVLMFVALMALVLAACSDQATKVGDRSGDFLLALPRVTIDVSPQGAPSVGNVDASVVKALSLGQVDLSQTANFPTDYVDWFTRSNVQHMELVHKDDGLFIFVNNKPLPHVGWTGQSLSTAGTTVSESGMLDPRMAKLVQQLLPLVRHVGMDVALRFPMQAGAKTIPLRDASATVTETKVNEPGTGMVQARAHITYDQQGVPSMDELTTRDLENATGFSFRQAELSPALVKQMMDAGIQHITLTSGSNGVVVAVNGQALPSLVWSAEDLKNGAAVYGQLYSTDDYKGIRQVVDLLVPQLKNVDSEVILQFPVASGTKAVPLPTPSF